MRHCDGCKKILQRYREVCGTAREPGCETGVERVRKGEERAVRADHHRLPALPLTHHRLKPGGNEHPGTQGDLSENYCHILDLP